jgi:ribose transport system substrate-binding protein
MKTTRNAYYLWALILALAVFGGCAEGKKKNTTAGGQASDPVSTDTTTTSDANTTIAANNDTDNGDEPKSRGTIGVSLLTFENPFFTVIGDNIEAAAKKHGYEVKVLSAEQNPEKQNDQIKDFITSKCVAIVLSPCESRSVGPAIKQANEANIPVFTVDIPCNEKGVDIACQITTDNYGGGKEAGNAMVEVLGETGGEVLVLHYFQAESCRLRVKGFTEVIDAHNKTADNKITVVAEMEGGGDREKGNKATEDALQSNPNLAAIFAINDPSALGAYAALEKANKQDQVTIIGFDGQPEGKQAIKDGKIYADPIQFPDVMGQEIVKQIVAYYNGEEVPKEILIPTKLYKKEDAMKDASLNDEK